MELLVFNTIEEISKFINEAQLLSKTIGFVPTMGALHEGHLALVRRSLSENDVSIVSIFVNPTQFNNLQDLALYPRTPEQDFEKLRSIGCTAVFHPEVSEMYPQPEENFDFDLGNLNLVMEGPKRPGHFKGVVTIVKKLFEIVKPTRAYFGLKDFQQVAVINKMVNDLRLPLTIVPCPTLREPDGLAMSSRNIRLNPEERKESLKIFETLNWIKANKGKKLPAQLQQEAFNNLKTNLITPEYVEIVNPVTLQTISTWHDCPKPVACIAAWCGNTRLIDNMEL